MELAYAGNEASALLAVNAMGLTAGLWQKARGLAAELCPFCLALVGGAASQPYSLPCSAFNPWYLVDLRPGTIRKMPIPAACASRVSSDEPRRATRQWLPLSLVPAEIQNDFGVLTGGNFSVAVRWHLPWLCAGVREAIVRSLCPSVWTVMPSF